MKFKDLHTLELVAHYLRQSNACCIAGFGIFRLEKLASHIDPIAQKFQPMELTPIFTQGNYETSTNFVSYCGSVWGLSFLEAFQKVKLQLELSSHELLNEGKLNIEELGLFSQGQNGIIHFEFAKNKWTAASSFGLTGIRFIQETTQPKKILIDRSAKPGEHEEIEETRENALRELKKMLEDAGVENNLEQDNHKSKSKVFPILATVLTLILLINVVLFLQKHPHAAKQTEIAKMNMAELAIDNDSVGEPLKFDQNKEQTVQNTQTNASNLSSNLLFNPGFAISKTDFEFDSNSYFNNTSLLQLVSPLEIKLAEPTKPIEQIKIEKNFLPENPVIATIEPKVTTENSVVLAPSVSVNSAAFHLIVGAFGNYENAIKLQTEFQEKGFKEVQLIPSKKKGMTLVSIQKVRNETEANDLKTSLDSQGIESWVFSNEK